MYVFLLMLMLCTVYSLPSTLEEDYGSGEHVSELPNLADEDEYEHNDEEERDISTRAVGGWFSPTRSCRYRRISLIGIIVPKRKLYVNGEVVYPVCKEKYIRTKSSNRFICINGRWKGHFPPCIRVNCEDEPPSIDHGRIQPYSGLHNSTVEYECEEGFVLEEHSKVQCLFGEWKGVPPKCRDSSRCYKHDLRKTHGLEMKEGFVLSGDFLTVKCREGFTAVEDSHPYCSYGNWLQAVPPCREKNCLSTKISNGDFCVRKRFYPFQDNQYEKVPLGRVHIPGEKLFVKCKFQYTFQGNGENLAEVKCSEGKWHPEPMCLKKTCAATTFPNGGFHEKIRSEIYNWQYIYRKVPYGRVFDQGEKTFVICEDQFTFEGRGREVAEVKCSNGRWNPEPECLQTLCEDEPPKIDHGSVSSFSRLHSSTVEYECEEGYTLMEFSKVQCLSGEWKGIPPKCEEKKCVSTEVPNGGFHVRIRSVTSWISRYVYGRVPNGRVYSPLETAFVICEDQFSIEGGGQGLLQVKCSKGQWDPEPVCLRARCENEPPIIDNGRVKSYSGHHHSTVEYECDDGYYMKERSKLLCVLGVWEGSPPTCYPKSCITTKIPNGSFHVKIRTKYRITPDDYTEVLFQGVFYNRKKMLVVCDDQYTFQGRGMSKVQVECSRGRWEPEPICRKANCEGEPSRIDHGRFKPYFGSHNSVVEYECDEGYVLDDTSEVYCFYGEWRGDPPKCQKKRCEKEPPSIDHGSCRVPSRSHDSTVEYECEEGYILEQQESSQIKCLYGVWTGVPPMCRKSICYKKDLPETHGLKMDSSFISSGDIMTVICIEGFTIMEDYRPYCYNGDWVQSGPPCKEKSCLKDPPTINDGHFKSYSGDHNSTVLYECEDGFALKELKFFKVQCLYGKWEGIPPTCQPKRCENEPPSIDHGSYRVSSRNHNAIAEYECEDGYFFGQLESSKVQCLFGVWKGVPQNCQKNSCLTVYIPNGSFLTKIRVRATQEDHYVGVEFGKEYSSGKKLFVMCENQFTFQGKGQLLAEVQCSGGKWNPEPLCLSSCGLRSDEYSLKEGRNDSLAPLIVGGIDAKKSWPWMVALYAMKDDQNLYTYICGGSVITPRHVLTAAHCLDGRSKFVVRWGSLTITPNVVPDVDKRVLVVSGVRVNEGYRQGTLYDDIAVLLVEGRMETSPVCLPFRSQALDDRVTATLTGWGRTSFGLYSSHLQEVQLQVIHHEQCREAYATANTSLIPQGIKEPMICTLGPGKDGCKGDSGSPLVTQVEENRWVQIGVVSFGWFCNGTYPGVLTKASSYVDWIREAVDQPWTTAPSSSPSVAHSAPQKPLFQG